MSDYRFENQSKSPDDDPYCFDYDFSDWREEEPEPEPKSANNDKYYRSQYGKKSGISFGEYDHIDGELYENGCRIRLMRRFHYHFRKELKNNLETGYAYQRWVHLQLSRLVIPSREELVEVAKAYSYDYGFTKLWAEQTARKLDWGGGEDA